MWKIRMGVDETICLVCGGSTFVGETISCETCLHWWATSSQAPCNPVIPSRYHFNCVGVTHTDDCVVKEDVPYFCPRFSNTNTNWNSTNFAIFWTKSPAAMSKKGEPRRLKSSSSCSSKPTRLLLLLENLQGSPPLHHSHCKIRFLGQIRNLYHSSIPIRSLGANWRWIEEVPRRKQRGKTSTWEIPPPQRCFAASWFRKMNKILTSTNII